MDNQNSPDIKSEELEYFFRNPDLACLADAMAQRYGKTPYEVMAGMTLYEFSFNSAVMAVACIREKEIRKQQEKEREKYPKGVPEVKNKKGVPKGFKHVIKKKVNKKGKI